MNHEYFKDRVSAYHDGELRHEEEQMIAEHIQGCEECQKLLSDLEKLDKMVSEHSGLSESEYWEKSAQRIESAISPGSETEVVEVRRGSYRGLWWKVGALAASAAVIVIIAVYQGDISHKILDETNSGSVPRQRKSEIQLKADTAATADLQKPSEANRGQNLQPALKPAEKKAIPQDKLGQAAKNAEGEAAAESDASKQAAPSPPLQSKSMPLHHEPIRPSEVQVTKEMIARKATGEVSPKSVAKARIAGQSTGELTPAQKPEAGLELFKEAGQPAMTLDQWKTVRDSLQPVVAARAKLKSTGPSSGKAEAGEAALADKQAEPESRLLEAYSQIALLTSDSLEYKNSVDSLSAYASRKDELYRSEAEALLKQVENFKKAKARDSGHKK
jgi:hypothetical protein